MESDLLTHLIYTDLILKGLIKPYDTRHLTTDGSKRVSWENLGEKYPTVEYFEAKFRFRPSHIQTLIEALKV